MTKKYYLGLYYGGGRWRLITREMHEDKKVVEKHIERYEKSVKTKLVTLDLPM
jgi:hypothetical protein